MKEKNSEKNSADLTAKDMANMKLLLKALYHNNPSVVDNWEMNEDVFFIIQDILKSGRWCTDTMNIVPHPTDFIGAKGVRKVKEILEEFAKRIAKEKIERKFWDDRQMKFVCENSLGWSYRTRLEQAGSGIIGL